MNSTNVPQLRDVVLDVPEMKSDQILCPNLLASRLKIPDHIADSEKLKIGDQYIPLTDQITVDAICAFGKSASNLPTTRINGYRIACTPSGSIVNELKPNIASGNHLIGSKEVGGDLLLVDDESRDGPESGDFSAGSEEGFSGFVRDFNAQEEASQACDSVVQAVTSLPRVAIVSCLSETRKNVRCLYGATHSCYFGPKAVASTNQAATITIQDPGCQLLRWHQRPTNVLIVHKVDCLLMENTNCKRVVAEQFLQLALWLVEVQCMILYVEDTVLSDSAIEALADFKKIRSKLVIFNRQTVNLAGEIDLIACLGSDSALLSASSLFQKSVPPVMAFRQDPHGFLSPLKFADFKAEVTRILDGNAVSLTLRTRLICKIRRRVLDNEEAVDTVDKNTSKLRFQILNEVSLERGATSYLCHLDLHIDNKIVTTVLADGLLISTPTGSTAYAAATGSSVLQPSVPSVLITPVCPHSLSFRPILVPAAVLIKVTVSSEARSSVWVSFDGRDRLELCRGDALTIKSSRHPLPSVCSDNQISDWFERLADCLQWNARKVQRRLD